MAIKKMNEVEMNAYIIAQENNVNTGSRSAIICAMHELVMAQNHENLLNELCVYLSYREKENFENIKAFNNQYAIECWFDRNPHYSTYAVSHDKETGAFYVVERPVVCKLADILRTTPKFEIESFLWNIAKWQNGIESPSSSDTWKKWSGNALRKQLRYIMETVTNHKFGNIPSVALSLIAGQYLSSSLDKNGSARNCTTPYKKFINGALSAIIMSLHRGDDIVITHKNGKDIIQLNEPLMAEEKILAWADEW